MISAKVIADSLNTSQYSILEKRLTTFELVFPRFILPQFNTHRVFSRNAASSRAIPLAKTIKQVIEMPVMPIWNKNQPGMQGTFDVTSEEEEEFIKIWLDARDDAVKHAKRFKDAEAHKQIANRILEPYMFTKVVLTSTEWENFFNLRIHEGAQPEIERLAILIKERLLFVMENGQRASDPVRLKYGEWHLPYVLPEEKTLPIDVQVKISVARCARVSYKLHDDSQYSTVDKDVALYEALYTDGHMSPFEHQATPYQHYQDWMGNPHLQGNLKGWKQHRKLLEGSN